MRIQSSKQAKSTIALQWFMPSVDDVHSRTFWKYQRAANKFDDYLIHLMLHAGTTIQYAKITTKNI